MPANMITDGFDGRLLVWGADGIEPNTLDQAHKAARLPFVEEPVALMPDAHVGIGATVGSVIATHGAIIPAAVGVDIGCGMAARRFDIREDQLPDNLYRLHALIANVVPAGVGQAHDADQAGFGEHADLPMFVRDSDRLVHTAVSQLGTLGSGNHFVELCIDEEQYVWIVLHSGSRGVGNKIAMHHIERARGLMRRYFISLDEPDLAYFVQGTEAFAEYLSDMTWAQDYAFENRRRMLTAVSAALMEAMEFAAFEITDEVQCHHNYTELEHHHGKDLYVTRKGAIRARTGDKGIIPGSMATGSYIVRGLGNERSYCSASHGAGRRMSRGQAKRTVTETQLRAAMLGKTWNDRDAKVLLDEAPAAYKPIEEVMAAQSDLVEVVHTLRQVLNYKGT